MKNKKIIIIVSLIIVAVIVTIFFVKKYKKNKTNSELDPDVNTNSEGYIYKFNVSYKFDGNSSTKLKEYFSIIKKLYGLELAKTCEKIARLETAHFKSDLFRKTNNPGCILSFNDTYPHGWNELKAFWNKNTNIKPINIYLAKNGYKYLVFNSTLHGLISICEILKTKSRTGFYFSNNINEALSYENKLASINTLYV